MIKVIIADDHPLILSGIQQVLERDTRISIVGMASSTAEVFQLLSTQDCDVLLTDYHFEGGTEPDGLSFLGKVHRVHPKVRMVVISMFGSPNTLKATRAPGVYGAVSKGTNLDFIIPVVIAAASGRQLMDSKVVQGAPAKNYLPLVEPVQRTLSQREEEVVRLLLTGMRVSEIASQLKRSRKTISSQKSSAMTKLGARSDADLYRIGFALLDQTGTPSPDLAPHRS